MRQKPQCHSEPPPVAKNLYAIWETLRCFATQGDMQSKFLSRKTKATKESCSGVEKFFAEPALSQGEGFRMTYPIMSFP